MSFKAGDAVWAQSGGRYVSRGWHAAVVIGGPYPHPMYPGDWYSVELIGIGKFLSFEKFMRPRWQDGDSSARGDWSKIPWKPSKERPAPPQYTPLPDAVYGDRRVPVKLRWYRRFV